MKIPDPMRSLAFLAATSLMVTFALSARADYSSTVQSQQPVGYWRLNETAQPPVLPMSATNRGSLAAAGNGDILGGAVRGQPGALTGSSDTSYGFSNPGWVVGYFGSHVDVAYNAALNPNGPFTVEFWAKPNSAPPDLFSPVCALDATQNNGSSREGYLFYIDGPGSRWQFRMGGPNGYGNNSAIGGTFTAGAWHHIVGVYDGSSMFLYVNGAQAATVPVAAGSFVPNGTQPFRIGATTIPNRTFDGSIDEVAFYGSALSAATVKAHFDAATTNGAGYANLILASSPVGYWRLGEPGDPPAANLGTLGSAGNGSYTYSAKPGVASVRPPTYPGFDAGNNAVNFDGSGGYVSVPALNLNTNAVTITGWVNANGQQAPGTGIIFNRAGATVAGLSIDVVGGLSLTYNWAADNSTFNWASGVSLPDSDWAFVALIVQPNQAAIFVANDTNYTSFNGATNQASHAVQPFEGATLFGTDLTPDGGLTGPANFAGSIDEVAIFNRALGVGEVYTEYASAVGDVPPQIFADPAAPANQLFDGDTLTLAVDAGGTPALSYQWWKGTSAITGATSSAYVKPNIQVGDAGDYKVVVTNAFGSVTSGTATVTVLPVTPPSISQQPAGATLYAGGTLNLSVGAAGGQLAYQWFKDNNALNGATSSAYVVPSVAAGNAGSYTVTVTNRLGTASSTPAAVVAVITPAAGTFEATVVGDAPEAWWRLDETTGATVMVDSMGRHNGTYVGNVGFGAAGVVATGGDTAVTLDGSSYGKVPFSPLLNTRTFTVEMWAKAVSLTDTRAPASSRFSTKGWWFWSAVPGNGQWSGGVSSGGRDFYVPTTTAAASMQTNQWTYLVMTSGTNGLLVYINGQWDGQAWADFDRNTGGPFIIGARGVSAGQTADEFWKGQVDEVAFYTNSLTLEQVQAHYAAALYGNNSKPVFKLQPQSQVATVGSQVSFKVLAEGTAPIDLQWYKDNAALTGQTSDTLVLSNLSGANVGNYQVIATNTAGSTTSATASLSVQPVPTSANITNGLVLHLKLDNDYSDSSGLGHNATPNGTPTFIAGQIGANAVQLNTDSGNSVFNYLSIPANTDLAFGPNVSFSVSFWINYNTNADGTYPDDLPMIGNSLNSTYQKGWVFADDTGQLEWTLVANDNTSVIADPVGGPVISDAKWHHVMASFDRSVGIANTYIDGVQVDSRSIQGLGGLDNGNPIALAQDPSGAYAVDGTFKIDDVGIWRTALTTYDAQAIFTVGKNSGKSFDTPSAPAPTLVFGKSGNSWVLTYTGTLYSSSTANGSYAPVNGASSPYTIPANTTIQFYRAGTP